MAVTAASLSQGSVPSITQPAHVSKLASYWSAIRDTGTQMCNSVVGKITVCAAAEMAGAYVGEFLASQTIGKVFSVAGETLGPWIPAVAAAGCVALVVAAKTSRKAKMILSSAVVASTLLVMRSQDFSSYSIIAGNVIGGKVALVVGSILGGFVGLKLVGSRIRFVDIENRWDCYSVCMIRFFAAGALFDAIIVKPTIPLVGPILNTPRVVIKASTQFLAYSFNTFFPVIRNFIFEDESSKRQFVPFIGEALSKRFDINPDSIPLGHVYDKVFPSFLSILGKCGLLPKVLDMKMVRNFIARSLFEFFSVLKESGKIKMAVQEYQDAFLEKPQLISLRHDVLINAIEERISGRLQLSVADRLCGMLFSEAPFANLIKDLERMLIGFPLIQKTNAAFLDALFLIIAKYYFVFLLNNYKEVTEGLDSSEEKMLLSDIKDGIFTLYLSSIMPRALTDSLHEGTDYIIRITNVMKKFILNNLRKPETNLKKTEENEGFEIMETPLPGSVLIVSPAPSTPVKRLYEELVSWGAWGYNSIPAISDIKKLV